MVATPYMIDVCMHVHFDICHIKTHLSRQPLENIYMIMKLIQIHMMHIRERSDVLIFWI